MSAIVRWLPVAVGIALVAGFLRLAQWQTDRAEFKDTLFARFDTVASRPAERLASLPAADRERFTPVRVTGSWVEPHRIYLENQVVAGQSGVHLFVPLETSTGSIHLVNLGWQPMAADRSLPEATPLAPAQEWPALLAPPPASGVKLGELGLDAQRSPYRVPWIDLDALGGRLNLALEPQILLATAPSDTYRREWRPSTMSADKHRAYAFQWYALAAAVGLLTAWGMRRLLARRDDETATSDLRDWET